MGLARVACCSVTIRLKDGLGEFVAARGLFLLGKQGFYMAHQFLFLEGQQSAVGGGGEGGYVSGQW